MRFDSWLERGHLTIVDADPDAIELSRRACDSVGWQYGRVQVVDALLAAASTFSSVSPHCRYVA